MSIKPLTNEIIERFNYYEKRRFGYVEAECLNLEAKYDKNDDSAQGFWVAIRKQEHWTGKYFKEIAKELLAIKDSKILRYLIVHSVDCDLEMLEEIFEPKMYEVEELQEIARHANSNKMLELIFDYVYYNVEMLKAYGIMCCSARNKVAGRDLLDKLYAFDKRVAPQIFGNEGQQASTELLMKMFYEDDDIMKELDIGHLVQFNRPEINQQLKQYLMCRFTKSLEFLKKCKK